MASVLVIAEERLARQIAWVLESAGYETRMVHDADAGLQEVKADRPDVIVVNSVVPADQISAYIGQLERAAPGVGIVDISQKLGGEVRPATADAQLTQPFHADELLQEIDRLARR